MFRPVDIRPVPVFNDANITITNRTDNIADLRHCRRRIQLGLGHLVCAIWPRSQYHVHTGLSPLLGWTWNHPEDSSAGGAEAILEIIPPGAHHETRKIAFESTHSRHFVC